MNQAVEIYLDAQPVLVQALLRRLQSFLLTFDPQVTEVFKWNIPFYSYHGLLCYLNPNPKRQFATLGFVQGAQLPDPAGLLTGTSKTVRHARIQNEDDIYQPALAELVQQAMRLNAARAQSKKADCHPEQSEE